MLALLCSLVAMTALGQDTPLPQAAPPPANLTFVEGIVDLVHEGAADRAAAPVMLVDGDVIRTLNGRAEIVFADGTLLHLDHDTDLELLSPSRLRLISGRVLVRTSAAATAAYTIDTQAASLRLEPRGEYGVTSHGRLGKLELTVARGGAELDDAGSRTLVRAGEMATILGTGGRVHLETFNSARWDTFALWANDRTNGFATAPSARQLPPELRPYGHAFDAHGRWDHVAPYGNVWFPSVGAEWRPYYTGSWTLTRYGWTWIGHDPWAWPTHHFGRWGFTGAAWYWVPANAWGPAWVSWSFVPGYVSWRPLHPRDHPAYWPNYDPWRSRTVVPRDSFGGRRSVRTHAVDPSRLPERTRGMLSNAVPRGTLSAPTATRGMANGVPTPNVAVPRDSVPGPRPGNVRYPDRMRPAPPPPRSAEPQQASEPQRTPEPQRSSEPQRRAEPRRYGDSPAYAPAYAPPASTPRSERADEPRRGEVRNPENVRPRTQDRERAPEASAAPPPPPRRESRGGAGGAVSSGGGGGARRRPPQN